eukprot:2918242-Prymnesium_polylepis.1
MLSTALCVCACAWRRLLVVQCGPLVHMATRRVRCGVRRVRAADSVPVAPGGSSLACCRHVATWPVCTVAPCAWPLTVAPCAWPLSTPRTRYRVDIVSNGSVAAATL